MELHIAGIRGVDQISFLSLFLFPIVFFYIIAFSGHFCRVLPVAAAHTNTHTHDLQLHRIAQIQAVFAVQETHTVLFAVSTKADVKVSQNLN